MHHTFSVAAKEAKYTPAQIGGLVYGWLVEADLADLPAGEIINHVLESYGFPVSPMGGRVLFNGHYRSDYHPDDPDLPAHMTCHFIFKDFYVVFYDYGIVAFVDDSTRDCKVTVYRLD